MSKTLRYDYHFGTGEGAIKMTDEIVIDLHKLVDQLNLNPAILSSFQTRGPGDGTDPPTPTSNVPPSRKR